MAKLALYLFVILVSCYMIGFTSATMYQCLGDTEFSWCGGCPQRACGEAPKSCIAMCREGCFCKKPNHVLLSREQTSICVPESQCPLAA